jgi:hypothetical protein
MPPGSLDKEIKTGVSAAASNVNEWEHSIVFKASIILNLEMHTQSKSM